MLNMTRTPTYNCMQASHLSLVTLLQLHGHHTPGHSSQVPAAAMTGRQHQEHTHLPPPHPPVPVTRVYTLPTLHPQHSLHQAPDRSQVASLLLPLTTVLLLSINHPCHQLRLRLHYSNITRQSHPAPAQTWGYLAVLQCQLELLLISVLDPVLMTSVLLLLPCQDPSLPGHHSSG